MTRIEQIVLGWFTAIFIYLIFAVNIPIWNAYFYGVWQLLVLLLLIELRSSINKFLLYAAIIFDLEYFGYNILITFEKPVQTKEFVIIFIGSIIILLLTTYIYNVWQIRNSR